MMQQLTFTSLLMQQKIKNGAVLRKLNLSDVWHGAFRRYPVGMARIFGDAFDPFL